MGRCALAMTEMLETAPDSPDTPGASASDDAAKGAALLALSRAFIAKQRIGCAEDVYQTDHVIVNGYDFIANICEVVGYDTSD